MFRTSFYFGQLSPRAGSLVVVAVVVVVVVAVVVVVVSSSSRRPSKASFGLDVTSPSPTGVPLMHLRLPGASWLQISDLVMRCLFNDSFLLYSNQIRRARDELFPTATQTLTHYHYLRHIISDIRTR